MKTYTKEWYKEHELHDVQYWFIEDEAMMYLPLLDEGIPRQSDEVFIDASPYLSDKSAKENQMRMLLQPCHFPPYNEGWCDKADKRENSVENFLKYTLINRFRICAMLPQELQEQILDKRLFVLGTASKALIGKVKRYCNNITEDNDETENTTKRICEKLTIGKQIEKEYNGKYSLGSLIENAIIEQTINKKGNFILKLSSNTDLILSESETVE